jgi:hypothetical protein
MLDKRQIEEQLDRLRGNLKSIPVNSNYQVFSKKGVSFVKGSFVQKSWIKNFLSSNAPVILRREDTSHLSQRLIDQAQKIIAKTEYIKEIIRLNDEINTTVTALEASATAGDLTEKQKIEDKIKPRFTAFMIDALKELGVTDSDIGASEVTKDRFIELCKKLGYFPDDFFNVTTNELTDFGKESIKKIDAIAEKVKTLVASVEGVASSESVKARAISDIMKYYDEVIELAKPMFSSDDKGVRDLGKAIIDDFVGKTNFIKAKSNSSSILKNYYKAEFKRINDEIDSLNLKNTRNPEEIIARNMLRLSEIESLKRKNPFYKESEKEKKEYNKKALKLLTKMYEVANSAQVKEIDRLTPSQKTTYREALDKLETRFENSKTQINGHSNGSELLIKFYNKMIKVRTLLNVRIDKNYKDFASYQAYFSAQRAKDPFESLVSGDCDSDSKRSARRNLIVKIRELSRENKEREFKTLYGDRNFKFALEREKERLHNQYLELLNEQLDFCNSKSWLAGQQKTANLREFYHNNVVLVIEKKHKDNEFSYDVKVAPRVIRVPVLNSRGEKIVGKEQILEYDIVNGKPALISIVNPEGLGKEYKSQLNADWLKKETETIRKIEAASSGVTVSGKGPTLPSTPAAATSSPGRSASAAGAAAGVVGGRGARSPATGRGGNVPPASAAAGAASGVVGGDDEYLEIPRGGGTRTNPFRV